MKGDPVPDNYVEQAVPIDQDQKVRFIEKMALGLVGMGWPRMPARIFAALEISEEGQLTARELSDTLSISPASVSGAVRYLDQLGLVTKVRLPGQRRDRYRLNDNLWYTTVLKRDRMVTEWSETAKEGIELVGAATPAGRRLAEMRNFFEFFAAELPALLERWQAQRRH